MELKHHVHSNLTAFTVGMLHLYVISGVRLYEVNVPRTVDVDNDYHVMTSNRIRQTCSFLPPYRNYLVQLPHSNCNILEMWQLPH